MQDVGRLSAEIETNGLVQAKTRPNTSDPHVVIAKLPAGRTKRHSSWTALDLVRSKEDSEDTNDSVKTFVWIRKGQHIRLMEKNIFQKAALSLCPSQFEKIIGQINPND